LRSRERCAVGDYPATEAPDVLANEYIPPAETWRDDHGCARHGDGHGTRWHSVGLPRGLTRFLPRLACRGRAWGADRGVCHVRADGEHQEERDAGTPTRAPADPAGTPVHQHGAWPVRSGSPSPTTLVGAPSARCVISSPHEVQCHPGALNRRSRKLI